MKLLVVGKGGREHAFVWKLAQSPKITRLYAAPGNPGMAQHAECVDIADSDLEGLAAFVQKENIDITVIGPEAPLADAASGGETSRAMLALKSALAVAHAPPVLFFDEVDAGVGGRLGEVVGRKLKALSRDHQVIAITHLAQVAARADRHLKVTKTVRGGRTLAGVETLDGAPRVEELAQMIHGKASTATTRKQAREMLRQQPSDS